MQSVGVYAVGHIHDTHTIKANKYFDFLATHNSLSITLTASDSSLRESSSEYPRLLMYLR